MRKGNEFGPLLTLLSTLKKKEKQFQMDYGPKGES